MMHILAGTEREAKEWADVHVDLGGAWVYISEERQVRGLTHPAYVIVGTYWDRTNANDLLMALMSTEPRLHDSQCLEMLRLHKRARSLEIQLRLAMKQRPEAFATTYFDEPAPTEKKPRFKTIHVR